MPVHSHFEVKMNGRTAWMSKNFLGGQIYLAEVCPILQVAIDKIGSAISMYIVAWLKWHAANVGMLATDKPLACILMC